MAFATFFYYIHGSLILTKFKTMKKGKFAFLLIGMLFSVNVALGQTTVTVTGGSSAGTYDIDQQSTFSGYNSDADALKVRLDTFKV